MADLVNILLSSRGTEKHDLYIFWREKGGRGGKGNNFRDVRGVGFDPPPDEPKIIPKALICIKTPTPKTKSKRNDDHEQDSFKVD